LRKFLSAVVWIFKGVGIRIRFPTAVTKSRISENNGDNFSMSRSKSQYKISIDVESKKSKTGE
jgi:hypothetical protein